MIIGICFPSTLGAQEVSPTCDSSECCQETEGAELHGEVLAAESSAAIPGATVEFQVTAPPVEGRPSTVKVKTDASGSYRLCGISTPAAVEAQAERSGAISRSVSFRLESPGRVELSFEIKGAPTGLDSLQAAAAASREASAPGRITGRIEDASSGQPVAEATVTLTPGDRQALTDGQGRFTIQEAPAGQGKLAIHHVAYGDQTVEVDVPSELTLNLDIELPPKAIEVEPIDVRVEATIRSRYLENRGFYDRMERDFGKFWSPEELERRNPARVSHVLQQTPGVKLSSGGIPYMTRSAPKATGSYTRQLGGGGRMGGKVELIQDNRGFTFCSALLYLDGHQMPWRGMGIDEIINTSDLAAIEIYRGAAETAPEFISSNSACGVIVIWTKHGPGPPSGDQR